MNAAPGGEKGRGACHETRACEVRVLVRERCVEETTQGAARRPAGRKDPCSASSCVNGCVVAVSPGSRVVDRADPEHVERACGTNHLDHVVT